MRMSVVVAVRNTNSFCETGLQGRYPVDKPKVTFIAPRQEDFEALRNQGGKPGMSGRCGGSGRCPSPKSAPRRSKKSGQK